ncbi:hypothetical protein CC295_17105 [Salmonella enterica subsp. enterica serovar Senftenberg]|nr:hypothetical protein [Salmonella enterica subsp. enterica serovar Senftenberg]ECS6919219.1 hypothetical protein [Salmonella enterica subsp. enterica serovar Senftenberg]EDN0711094.1 hypothetical protein [Salmonella enterica subsp. enterica serovar Senftenberg]
MNGLVGLFIEILHQKMYQMKLFANHINFKICLLLSDDVLPRVTKKKIAVRRTLCAPFFIRTPP